MTSLEPCKREYTLTTLPLTIQTRILSYLSSSNQPFHARTNRWKESYWLPFKDPPVNISLDGGEIMTIPLPSELISPALASPILANAVATLLGDRVSYLTHCNTSAQLSNWVTAFAPYVKAVSVQDAFPASWVDELRTTASETQTWFTMFDTQIDYSVQLFRALSLDTVNLEVLDLLDVHFLNLNSSEDQLLAGLYTTLERNSASLRELALPVFRTSEVCETALSMLNLKKLDVFTAKLWSVYVVDESRTLESPFLRMIRAINGHADRERNLSTLRELRFLRFQTWERKAITPTDLECSLFCSVKTLRLFMDEEIDTRREAYPFISLFKNLQCLCCNLAPKSSDTRFTKLCTKLKEVHVSSSRWMTTCLQVGTKDHYTGRCSLFEECLSDSKRFGSGSIRTFFAGGVSRIEVRNMVKYCPNMENLCVHVLRDTIHTIRKLVAKCQRLKCLELVIDESQHGKLNEEDWRSISRIIPNSHKNLCQLAVQTADRDAEATKCIYAVFRCFETVIKSMGVRARRLAFRMVFGTRKGAKIIEKMCEVVEVCLKHTPELESMEFRSFLPGADRSNYGADWERSVVKGLSMLETRMLNEIRSLRMLDLGISPYLWELVNRDDEVVETDSIGSKEGSACS